MEKKHFDTYRLSRRPKNYFVTISKIINKVWIPKTQKTGGSHHYKNDLPKEFSDGIQI